MDKRIGCLLDWWLWLRVYSEDMSEEFYDTASQPFIHEVHHIHIVQRGLKQNKYVLSVASLFSHAH